MKAKVIGTGKWIDVCRKQRITMDVFVEYGTGKEWHYDEIALENEDKIGSYWFDKRNEFAGLAMQAMISSHMTIERLVAILKDRGDENATLLEKLVADRSVAFANALVEKLRKENNYENNNS